MKGVLHMAYFDKLNEAHNWLMARWAETAKRSGAKDAVDRADFQSSYGGAIYDQHEGRKRAMLLGAECVLKENGEKRGEHGNRLRTYFLELDEIKQRILDKWRGQFPPGDEGKLVQQLAHDSLMCIEQNPRVIKSDSSAATEAGR